MTVLAATLFLLPGQAAAQDVPAPAQAPAADSKRYGFEIELDLGLFACPQCAYDDAGLDLGIRAAWRLPSGLALGAYFLALNSNDDRGCDDPYYDDGDECFEDELVLLLFGGEARYHPFAASATSFDPYFGMGLGLGTGASREGGPDLAEYSGLVLMPRMGLLAFLSDSFSLGGSFGRTFAFWTTKCVDGDEDGGYYYGGYYGGGFTCADVEDGESPQAWFTTMDVSMRF